MVSDRQDFRAWRPLDGIPDALHVEAIHDDFEGLRFLLRGEDPASSTLRLRFESVVAYRNVNGSNRSRTCASDATRGLPTLMTVDRSEWVSWLVQESGGVLSASRLEHYAIYTGEDCVDIVTEFPPDVDWSAL